MDVPRREDWDGHPADLGEGFRLRKRDHQAVCWLRTHELGWELVLDVDGALQRSQVCRTQDDILNQTESWKAALLGRGWHSLASDFGGS